MPARGLAARFGFGGALRAGRVAATVATVVAVVAADGLAQTAPPTAQELARVENLVRANVLDLAREILESRAPKLRPALAWLAWERQLWAVYRVRGQWRELYARTAHAAGRPARSWPPAIRFAARLQAIEALVELNRGAEARRLIRRLLADAEAAPAHRKRARQALIAAYFAANLTDNLLDDARLALENFYADYGARDTDSLLLGAAVLLRAGDADAAINLIAPLNEPAARLLRLAARLANQTLAPAEVARRAQELLESLPAPAADAAELARPIRALIAQARAQAGAFYPLADALEVYLLTPASPSRPAAKQFGARWRAVFPRFTADDLFAAYTQVARHQAGRAGLAAGDARAWLEHARGLAPALGVARKALFAHLAAGASGANNKPELRRAALDGYIDALIDTDRAALVAILFDADAADADSKLGELSLGGRTALRLAARALAAGDFRLASRANAALREFPPELDRRAWLLRAARVDIFAGEHAAGAAKLTEYLAAFEVLDAAQTDAVLQVVFDLQNVGRHRLALGLLRRVEALAPPGKHRRELAYWLAESYAAEGQHRRAAELFLHSALLGEHSFDRWGRAARFRAAEALLANRHFADARRLFQDLLSIAAPARRDALRRKLQSVQLLEAAAGAPP